MNNITSEFVFGDCPFCGENLYILYEQHDKRYVAIECCKEHNNLDGISHTWVAHVTCPKCGCIITFNDGD